MRTTKLSVVGVALAISTAASAGSVPTSYVNTDHLDIIASGSGIVIGPHEVLTANHVADDCRAITVFGHDAFVMAHDEANDLAAVHTKDQWATWALFSNEPVHAGDQIVVMGYPLAGILADTANVSVGNVSALAGALNDSRFLQFTAPIQPGNSGGGLFDTNGGIIGIAKSVLKNIDEVIPQNVNFAIKSEQARTFLESNGIKYQAAPNLGRKLSSTEVAAMARPFTVRIECYGTQQGAEKIKPHPVQTTKPQFPTQTPLPSPQQPQPKTAATPQQPLPSNYYRVTQNLMLRAAPTKYSANLLAPYAPNDFIPEGSIFSYGPFHCTYGSGMYSQTDEVWCSVEYQHDGGILTHGWVSAHFLRDNYGNLLACRYATPDPECARY